MSLFLSNPTNHEDTLDHGSALPTELHQLNLISKSALRHFHPI